MVKLQVMINNNMEGHAGMRIDEGNDAILYDPGGSYSGCYKRPCRQPDGEPIERWSGDAFYGDPRQFEWNDYISYHLSDGPDITGYEFSIPYSHAERVKELISEYGGISKGLCAATTSNLLRRSGGVFAQLPGASTPWGLASDLKQLPGVRVIRY
jgi:hypothetical protein